jgi:hypothetical protein
VGRLTPEKNVRLLVELEQNLIAVGQRNFRFLLVGEGSEKEWLRRNLQFGEFPGVLHAHALPLELAGYLNTSGANRKKKQERIQGQLGYFYSVPGSILKAE